MKERKKILAIDPAPKQSAFVIWNGKEILQKDILDNWELLRYLALDEADFNFLSQPHFWVIEYIKSSHGMPVGEDTFQTVLWTGIFMREIGYTDLAKGKSWYCSLISRDDVKMHICNSQRAGDTNIIAALVDRFDPMRDFGKYGKGTKNNPGPLYGCHDDIWQALALGVTWWDLNMED